MIISQLLFPIVYKYKNNGNKYFLNIRNQINIS